MVATSKKPLTTAQLRHLPPGKHFDGGGLFIICKGPDAPSKTYHRQRESKHWYFRYKYAGREQRLALGPWPEVSATQARAARDDARSLLRKGIDPAAHRKQESSQAKALAASRKNTFHAVATEWLEWKAAGWGGGKNGETYKKALGIINNYFAEIKEHPIGELRTPDIVPLLRRCDAKAPSLAEKARQYINNIAEFAIQDGRRDEERGVFRLNGVLGESSESHYAAATKPENIEAVMRKIHTLRSEVTRRALMMLVYSAQRPGNVVEVRWDNLDMEKRMWTIPGEKLKGRSSKKNIRDDHYVPMSDQMHAIFESMRDYTAGYEWVFPPLAKQGNQFLSRDALSKTLRVDLGLKGVQTPHGFRATLRTAAREQLKIDMDVLEAQLAHKPVGQVAQAYDRTQFVDERIRVSQIWADWVDNLTPDIDHRPRREIAMHSYRGSRR